jgi:hypothetical protein
MRFFQLPAKSPGKQGPRDHRKNLKSRARDFKEPVASVENAALAIEIAPCLEQRECDLDTHRHAQRAPLQAQERRNAEKDRKDRVRKPLEYVLCISPLADCKEDTHFHLPSDLVLVVGKSTRPAARLFPRDVDFDEHDLDLDMMFINGPVVDRVVVKEAAAVDLDTHVVAIDPYNLKEWCGADANFHVVQAMCDRVKGVPASDHVLREKEAGVPQVWITPGLKEDPKENLDEVKVPFNASSVPHLGGSGGAGGPKPSASLVGPTEDKVGESDDEAAVLGRIGVCKILAALRARSIGTPFKHQWIKHKRMLVESDVVDQPSPSYGPGLERAWRIVYSTQAIVGKTGSSWWNRCGDWLYNHAPFVHADETWITNQNGQYTNKETRELQSSSGRAWRFGMASGNRPHFRRKIEKGTQYVTAANFKSCSRVEIYTDLLKYFNDTKVEAIRKLHQRQVLSRDGADGAFQVLNSFVMAAVKCMWEHPRVQSFVDDAPSGSSGEVIMMNTLQLFCQQKLFMGIQLASTVDEKVKPVFYQRVRSHRSGSVDPRS